MRVRSPCREVAILMAIRAKAHAAATLLGEPAATEVRALLDALDTAELALAHEIHEHETSRVALREAIEGRARVRAAEADAETMRAIADDYVRARDLLDETRAEAEALAGLLRRVDLPLDDTKADPSLYYEVTAALSRRGGGA